MPPSRTTNAAQAATLDMISVTFLGTASAQPSSTRNHSSLALSLGGRGDIWLFDCGEATQQRIQRSNLKMGKIRKIFITHTHGDHIFGLAPLMAGCMNGAGGMVDGVADPRNATPNPEPVMPLEIYGPIGTRAYVRSALRLTHTRLEGRYVVHEMRFPRDPQEGDFIHMPRHRCELPGRNIPMHHPEGVEWGKGFWPEIFVDSQVSVSAAPIEHSVACIGYVFNEAPVPTKMDPSLYVPHLKRNKAPMSHLSRIQRGETITLDDGTVLEGLQRKAGRKVVILGDTHNPAPTIPLAMNADLLIHEATNAYLPGIDPDTHEEDTEETVQARTSSRGHSTPQMAGRFATAINAKRLALNHFSARYRGDDDVNEEAKAIMDAIKALAVKEYTGGEVVCARDYMTINVQHSRQMDE